MPAIEGLYGESCVQERSCGEIVKGFDEEKLVVMMECRQ